LISILAGMERAGVKVDVRRLGELSRDFAGRLVRLEEDIYRHAGGPFNINSGPQLREVLFDKLKLPPQQKTPGGDQSTAQDVLEELALKHPLPALLLQHRQLSKLKSTYLDALPALVNPDDGRIHASFNQSVAATGRLSSSDPNLQNIPVRSEEGRQIRQAFVALDGCRLLTADYSSAFWPIFRPIRRLFVPSRVIMTSTAWSQPGFSEFPKRTWTNRCGGWARPSTLA
jgi:DNA polymerase-1